MRVFARKNGVDYRLQQLSDADFDKVVGTLNSPRPHIVGIPAYYRASNPKDVWPRPEANVRVLEEADYISPSER